MLEQDVISDGSLSVAKTSGLNTTLNNLNSTINFNQSNSAYNLNIGSGTINATTARIFSIGSLYIDSPQRSGSVIIDQFWGFNGVYFGAGNSSTVAQVTNTGSFNTTSDDNIKFYEKDIFNGLEVINKLKPQSYIKTFKPSDDPDEDGWYECGLIAQEVEQIPQLSHAVTAPTNDDELYALNYNQILPYLISAVKELSQRVSLLEQP